jgi:hypothetical protein
MLVVLALLVIEFNSRMEELNRLLVEQEIVAAQYNDRMQTKAKLEAELAHADSDAAVIEYAYEHNMSHNGDIPIVPIQAYASTPVSEPPVIIVEPQKTNWENWFSLFVDSDESQ